MMDEVIRKPANYSRISKESTAAFSPKKLTLTGNFTHKYKSFNISAPLRRASMRQDILDMVERRTESRMGEQKVFIDENPMYEDPRDVIGEREKPAKPPRKRVIQGIAVSSPRSSKEGKSLLKEQKRKLTKKYEQLVTSLMERCEENVVQLSEKDSQIAKLKEKLKSVLEYNKLFAEENDQLRSQYETVVKYAEECKKVIKEERERNRVLDGRVKELQEKVKQYELPDRDHGSSTAIPLVEVCMSCSSRQIIVNQAREHNTRLQKDMQALKDVLYRLNVQLSRYQERLRSNIQSVAGDKPDVFKPGEKYDALDSLLTASLGYKETLNTEDGQAKTGPEETPYTGRTVDLTGLLSAQALAPLFDAYQENLQEKDTLILDYEKQFETMNKKSKLIVTENKSLTDKVKSLEEEVVGVRQSYKKLVVEKETGDIEKATLVERAERAESKLKEVYELYEDKMSAMMRDYETVHREYFVVKNNLEMAENKLAQLDVLRTRTVPADMHERRLDHCKRLLEELKHQYGMETDRKGEQLTKTQEQLKLVEDKSAKLVHENQNLKEELEKALKNVRLYRKAAVIFRQRLKSAAARVNRVRSSARRNKNNNSEPLRQAMAALDKIKQEIKTVKSRAYTSLEELERRIVEQERRAALAHAEYRRELERAALALEHKEGIIRSLIDKVADVEEVRLSQTNTHRLQGIITDSSPEGSPSPHPEQRKEAKPSVKLVPGPGGYFQEKEGKRKGK
ncbi:unnamed protein product [Spodoptera littoralis]|uniref:Uncharacterized protein n=1 Tax=Spodoptera littoralis TaxID=7109 RepID=A0A9P0N0Y8_SPOLI|nr:unnamed protein product [Spodoptera littoralis]CAH1640601.1 unnamed protein product [Spodoptera littoralis]